jgi:hypothetical protein
VAVLTVQQVALAGLTPTYAAAAAGGDSFANDGEVFLHVKNTNAAARTVTVASQRPATPGLAPANNAVVVPLTVGDKMIGPFDPTVWNDTNGLVQITYTAETGVTVAAIRL